MRFDGKTNKQKAVDLSIQKLSVCSEPAHELATSRIIKASKKQGVNEMKKEEVDAIVKKAVGGLESKLATANSIAKMDDPTKTHYNGLKQEEQTEFLKKSQKEQKELATPKQDETFSANGVTIKKSVVGEATFSFMKAQQEEIRKANELARLEKEKRELKEFTEQAELMYPNLPGDPLEKGKIMKSLANMPQEQRETISSMLKSGNDALEDAKVYQEIGTSGVPLTDSPLDRLNKMAIEKSKKDGTTEAFAYNEVLKTKEGMDLYREVKGG